jgi:hypothetical protein
MRAIILKTAMLIALLGVTPMAATQPDPATFAEPVISGTFPDPSVCRVGNDYYVVHSSFVFFLFGAASIYPLLKFSGTESYPLCFDY